MLRTRYGCPGHMRCCPRGSSKGVKKIIWFTPLLHTLKMDVLTPPRPAKPHPPHSRTLQTKYSIKTWSGWSPIFDTANLKKCKNRPTHTITIIDTLVRDANTLKRRNEQQNIHASLVSRVSSTILRYRDQPRLPNHRCSFYSRVNIK